MCRPAALKKDHCETHGWQPLDDFNVVGCLHCHRVRASAARARDPVGTLIHELVHGAERRAAEQGVPVRSDLREVVTDFITRRLRCTVSGMPFTYSTCTFWRLCLDQYPAGAGYDKSFRMMQSPFNVREGTGGLRETVEPYHIETLIVSTAGKGKHELFCNLDADADAYTAGVSDESLRADLATLRRSPILMAVLAKDAAAFEAETVAAEARWNALTNRSSPLYDAKVCYYLRKYANQCISGDVDQKDVATPDRLYTFKADFKQLLVVQRGRCAISSAVLRTSGQLFPSLNRRRRLPGHVLGNVDYVAHVCNGAANAKAVMDDVLDRKRMRELCFGSNLVSLTWLDRLALRLLPL
jgi:hypothetical protein